MDNFTQKMMEAVVSAKTGEGFDLWSTISELMRQEVETALNALLRNELTGVLGYAKSEQGAAANAGNARNGAYSRTLDTKYGKVAVSVPRDRAGEFSTALFEPYSRRTGEIADMVTRLYSSGCTDSEIGAMVNALYQTRYSRSTISAITDCVKEDVEAFRKRAIHPDWFAIFLDGTYVPLRRGTVEKECINLAIGIRDDGTREVLGWSITPTESAEEWESLLEGFKSRGLRSCRVLVSDGLAGISGVVDRVLPGCLRQRCAVHLARNLGAKVRKSDRKEAMQALMDVFKCATLAEAKEAFLAFVKAWSAKYKSIGEWAQNLDADELFAAFRFHSSLRRYVYTNNAIESTNKEIKRLVRKHVQFVTEEAMEKCLVGIFLNYNLRPGKRGLPEEARAHLADPLLED